MTNPSYQIIGLMSGTSGDGLDLAYCEFQKQENWSFEILESSTIPFPERLSHQLMHSHLLSALDLAILDVDFGKWMGEQVKGFCEDREIQPLAVCTHGHTVYHQPDKGLSLQIGNGWALHLASGLRVINDFRMLDVSLGGQGAPLVPIGDQLLFPQIDFCINLGGIANISMDQDGKRIAFDCCPFNLLLNAQANLLGAPFDRDGNWAREGSVNLALLQDLNHLPFYANKNPKSLGREDLERDFMPLIATSLLSQKDILCTLVEHYAIQIAAVILAQPQSHPPSVLITGGGAYNGYFIERLDYHLRGKWRQFQASSELIEFKEALIFGFLGVLRLRGEANALASVTGASRDSCGGTVFG